MTLHGWVSSHQLNELLDLSRAILATCFEPREKISGIAFATNSIFYFYRNSKVLAMIKPCKTSFNLEVSMLSGFKENWVNITLKLKHPE